MQDHGYYVLRFRLPDTERLMLANSIWAKSDKDWAFVLNAFRNIVMQNPDAKIDPANFVKGPFLTQADAKKIGDALDAELTKADPNRVSLQQLREAGVLDTPARLLHDPEISRMLAGQKAAQAGNADAPLKSPAADNVIIAQ